VDLGHSITRGPIPQPRDDKEHEARIKKKKYGPQKEEEKKKMPVTKK
jgi:hypothetical protein